MIVIAMMYILRYSNTVSSIYTILYTQASVKLYKILNKN